MLFQKSQQEREIDAPNEFQIFLKEEKLAQYNYSKPIVQYFQKLWKGSRKKKKKKTNIAASVAKIGTGADWVGLQIAPTEESEGQE